MTKIQQFNEFQVDLKQSILWQYNDATNLLSLIQQKQDWYSVYQSGFWGVWVEIVFTLTSVDLFGADIWSVILDVPLLVSDLPYVAQPTWGFNAYALKAYGLDQVVDGVPDDIIDGAGDFIVAGSTGTIHLLSIGMNVTGTGTSPNSVIVLIPDSETIYISHLTTVNSTESLTFSLDQDGTLASGSAVVTGLDTSVIFVGMDVTGSGIPASAKVLTVDDATTITLDDNATSTGASTLTFSITDTVDLTNPGLINNYRNYEQGNFSQLNQNLTLTLEEQKFLLRLRYFQLTTLTNIAGFAPNLTYSINEFLDYLCANSDIEYDGSIYVLDNLDMTITYHFTNTGFPLPLVNALTILDVWPRPAGVGILFTGLV